MFNNSVRYNGSMDKKDFINFKGDLGPGMYPHVRFPDFQTIPLCEKYDYPKEFTELKFHFPVENEEWEVFMVNGLKLLSSLGPDQFTISPIKWDRVNKLISDGNLEYPEATPQAGIGDGRHRTLALMKIYKTTSIPCVIEKEYSAQFRQSALSSGLLME
ncbi:hypothetical protein GPH17_10910 [Escherichia coli]|nr:hypothetical protein [Escherichia coli]EIW6486288.1 hypothetical protein [Escherichia coli]EJJ1097574.1 hypothetical protein [Escherichia coli]